MLFLRGEQESQMENPVRANERCNRDSRSVRKEDTGDTEAGVGCGETTVEEVPERRGGGLMRAAKQKRLEKAGWRVGDAADFLGLDDVESKVLDIKVALAKLLRSTRARRRLTQFELAERIGSSQSRVAKLEAGDPSVSMDLLVRSLIAAGAKTSELA